MKKIPHKETLQFGTEFDKNGAISSVEVAEPAISR